MAQLGIRPEAFKEARAAIMGLGPGSLVTPLDLVEQHSMSLFHAMATVELVGRFPAAASGAGGDLTPAVRTIPLTIRN